MLISLNEFIGKQNIISGFFFLNRPSFSGGLCPLGVSPHGFKVLPESPGMFYMLSPTTERKTEANLVCFFLRWGK